MSRSGQQINISDTGGVMRVRQSPWHSRDDSSRTLPPDPAPIIPVLDPYAFVPCDDAGIFIPVYRDGEWECFEIPASGDQAITAQDGVLTAENIEACDEPTNEVPTTSLFLLMGG
jgi:hypothetical protein